MKFDFDAFEFTGIIAPGSLLVVSFILLHLQIIRGLEGSVVLLGIVLASYVAGHIIAAIGNLFETSLRFVGIANLESLPSRKWLERGYYAEYQEVQLSTLIRTQGWLDFRSEGADQTARRNRRMLIKQLYQIAPNPSRLETFTGMTSLSRGLAISFFAVLILCVIAHVYIAAIFSLGAAGLMLYRVQRFSNSFSRELIQQVLQIRSS